MAYEISGKKVARIFGGQINFSNEVLRDSFIADPVKFTSQVKAAFNAKPELADISETNLFIPGDKTFIKTLPAADSVESFVRSLPYFKEELILDPGADSREQTAHSGDQITHIAFEKKLIEDLERPFLDAGKKVTAVVSSVNVLVNNFAQSGQYLLLIPFEKDSTIVAVTEGLISDLTIVPKEVMASRIGEFIVSHNLNSVHKVYTVGMFPPEILDRLRTERSLEIAELAPSDIYDLTVQSFFAGAGSKGGGVALPNLGGLKDKLPRQKYLFLAGAVVVGFLLAILVIKNVSKISLPSFSGRTAVKTPVAVKPTVPQPVAPQPKPSDYKVRVLNGTLVAGEAGRAADSLKNLGYDVTDTGNATAAGFVATRLRVTSDVPQQIIDQLKTTLLQTYDSVSQEGLSDDQVKIEVIIGQKKAS